MSAKLELLAAARIVEIETRRGPRSPIHRTKIWVVVDGADIYIRSYTGERGRWYREVRAHPNAALWVRGERIPVRAIHVRSARSIARASAGYREKYGTKGPAAEMVRK